MSLASLYIPIVTKRLESQFGKKIPSWSLILDYKNEKVDFDIRDGKKYAFEEKGASSIVDVIKTKYDEYEDENNVFIDFVEVKVEEGEKTLLVAYVRDKDTNKKFKTTEKL